MAPTAPWMESAASIIYTPCSELGRMSALRVVLWIAVAIALFALGALAVSGYSLRAGRRARRSARRPARRRVPTDRPAWRACHRGDLSRKPSVTLFGFTHCPDVCPTGLMEMARWAEELGPGPDKLRFVFVTVDPERDTPQALGDYIAAFSDRIVGITGGRRRPRDDEGLQDLQPKSAARRRRLHDGPHRLDDPAGRGRQFVGTIDTRSRPRPDWPS